MAGMEVKYVPRKNGSGKWCYAEKRSRNRSHHNHNHHKTNHKNLILVFLHGFGADKDTWPSMIRHIPRKYHCVAVDLPGHGETTYVPEVDKINLDGYVESLKEFLEVTGLEKERIFLIGCSFGGALAGLYSTAYPDSIVKLGLLCPAVKSPILTKTCKELLAGNYDLLIPKNGKQFVKMIRLLANKRQPYPERIMQSFVNLNFTKERQLILKKRMYFMILIHSNEKLKLEIF